jgi:hypothetical protein
MSRVVRSGKCVWIGVAELSIWIVFDGKHFKLREELVLTKLQDGKGGEFNLGE